MSRRRKMPPIHPGETLREDFMKPLRLSVNRLALDLHVPATRIGEIANCRRAVSVDTALRLARYFGISPQFWLNLQSNYDLEAAQDRLAVQIGRQVRPRQAT